MTRVLMVCTGNICRSPTAEAVLRQRVAAAGLAVSVDSAGTHGYHIGEAPDRRSIQAAAARGYDLHDLRARKLHKDDYAEFDLLLALDEGHLAIMQSQCPPQYRHKVQLLMDYAPQLGYTEVPDPYYGPAQGFEEVLDLVEAAADGLIAALRAAR